MIWDIAKGPLISETESYYTKKPSYTFMLSVPFHQNEERRIWSNCEDACINFKKYGEKESDYLTNAIFIHIPEEVALEKIVKWLNLYLQSKQFNELPAIILYQLAVAQKGLTHTCIIKTANDKWVKFWGCRNSQLRFEFPIGTISLQPTEIVMQFDMAGSQVMIPISDRYIYQSGHHYVTANIDQGKNTGHLTYLFGIHKHCIVIKNGKEKELSGLFPPKNELLLFS